LEPVVWDTNFACLVPGSFGVPDFGLDHVPDFYDAEGSAGVPTDSDCEVDHNHIAPNPNDSALSCIDSALFVDTVREQLRYAW
jgi:hypothetical protein